MTAARTRVEKPTKYAHCPTCGTTLHDGECHVCRLVDWATETSFKAGYYAALQAFGLIEEDIDVSDLS